jgi:GT2 family glycosyltransferase
MSAGVPLVSVVIPTRDEGANVLDTVDAARRNSGARAEIVVVDDGSTDPSAAALAALAAEGRIRLIRVSRLGPARARNRGARAARGRFIAFLDAHCYVPPGWIEPLLEEFARRPEAGIVGPCITHTGDLSLCGYGGTWPDASLDMRWLPRPGEAGVAVPFQPAGCQMVRREVFEALGGYDPGLRRWGSEDVEFCLRAWLHGWENRVRADVTVAHVFRRAAPYAMDVLQAVYNKLRLIRLHFDGPRAARLLALHGAGRAGRAARARLERDDAPARARALRASRRRDTDWFCARFGLLEGV